MKPKPLTASFLLALALLPAVSSHVILKAFPRRPEPPPKQPYRGNEFHASGKKFYVSKPTNTSCPPADSFACPESTRTIFPELPYNKKGLNLTLYSYRGANQGAQQVYVADDYSLSFTAPGEAVPATALSYTFSAGPLLELIAYGDSFSSYICHNKKTGDYQAYFNPSANPPKRCDGNYFQLNAAFGAFEYV